MVLSRLEELKFHQLWQNGQRPAISAYLQRLKDHPSFEAAIGNDVMPLGMILPGLRRIFLGF